MLVTITPELPTLAAYVHFTQYQPRSHAWTSWVKSLASNFKIAPEDVRVKFLPMDTGQGRDDANLILSRIAALVERAPELQDDFVKLTDQVAAANDTEELVVLLPALEELSGRAASYPRAGVAVG